MWRLEISLAICFMLRLPKLMYYQPVCKESSPWIKLSGFDGGIGVNLSAADKTVPFVGRNTGVDVSLVVDINLYTTFENSFHLSSWTIAMKCQGHCYNAAVLSGGVARRSNFRHRRKDCGSMSITLEKRCIIRYALSNTRPKQSISALLQYCT